MDVVPISVVGVVQEGRGSAEVVETILGDDPKRNIQKMFGRKDEMEVQGLIAAEDHRKAPILFDPSKFPVELGEGRPKEVPVPIPTPCPGQVLLELLRSATIKFDGDDQKAYVRCSL
jgi:hypothetical protein